MRTLILTDEQAAFLAEVLFDRKEDSQGNAECEENDEDRSNFVEDAEKAAELQCLLAEAAR